MSSIFVLKSLGCRLNVAEMMEVEDALHSQGKPGQWISANAIQHSTVGKSQETVDLVIINTCAVTHKADKETRQLIRKMRRDYPKARLVVTGCFVGDIRPLKLAKDLKSKGYSSLAAIISSQKTLVVNNKDKDRLVEILQKKGWV